MTWIEVGEARRSWEQFVKPTTEITLILKIDGPNPTQRMIFGERLMGEGSWEKYLFERLTGKSFAKKGSWENSTKLSSIGLRVVVFKKITMQG
jgi:hypothetical protein